MENPLDFYRLAATAARMMEMGEIQIKTLAGD